MASNETEFVETIIATSFRYLLVFGFTTHLYDPRKHKLVHSRAAHCYSLLLHITLVILFPVFLFLSRHDDNYTETDMHFFECLFRAYMLGVFTTIFVAMSLQWTYRAKAYALFNEVLEIWHKDMGHLQRSREVGRKVGWNFAFKAVSTVLFLTNATGGTYYNTTNSLSVAQSVYLLALATVFGAVFFIFCSGMVFCEYLFRILNFNLAQIVNEINCLRSLPQRPRYALRHKVVKLQVSLLKIARIHARLQKCVIRSKDMYQVELLLGLISLFTLEILTFFILCVILHNLAWIGLLLKHLLAVIATLIVTFLDTTSMFNICGQLLEASEEAGEIMQDLVGTSTTFKRLDRCVEMVCLGLKRDKLRLNLCGLVNLDWSTAFDMVEGALSCIIILIQMDYADF